MTDGRKDGRMDGSVTISLRNFVGEGIIIITQYQRSLDNHMVVGNKNVKRNISLKTRR